MTLISLLFYLSFILYIIKKEPLIIILFYSSFLLQFTSYISVYYLDYGNIYMAELSQYTTTSYTSLIVFVFYILFSSLLFIFFKLNKKILFKYLYRVKYIKIKHIKKWILLFYIILIILIMHIIISGSPLWDSTINKTTFWTIAKFPFLKPLSSQMTIIALFSGMFLIYNYNNYNSKFISISLFGVLFLILSYLILMGHKFGQLAIMIHMFFLPILTNKILQNKISISSIIIKILAIIPILIVTILNYYQSKYGNNAIEMIQSRIFSMDGQLIYTGIQNYLNNDIPNDFNQLLIEIKYIIGFNSDNYVGMKFLMHEFMSRSFFNFYESESVTLAKGYIPMLFYLYNSFFLIIIIHILFVSIYFYVAFSLLKSIIKFDFIFSFLYLKIYFAFLGYYAQAYTTIIFNIKILIIVLILIFIKIGRKHFMKSRRNIYENITHN